jgi:serine/threonine-protein kinase
MSEREAKPIPGTMQDINTPFFSPDGKWIGFYVVPERTLKKIAITGGATVTIAEMGNPYGATWYSDDSIMVGQGAKGIIRVSAKGGSKPETVIEAKPNEVLHGPQVLPGGNELLFTVAGTTGDGRWDKAQIVVQSLKTGERKPLLTGGSDARYVPTGHIVYALGGNLFAVAFDAKNLQVTSGPILVVPGVGRSLPVYTAATFFSFSSTGHLVYVPGDPLPQNAVLTLVDRAGTKEALPLIPGKYSAPRISPNGKQVALEVNDGEEAFIAVYDLAGTSAMQKLTFGGRNISPLWTRDGRHIIFQSDRDGDGGLFWQRADGSGSPEKLTAPVKGMSFIPESARSDGKMIAIDGNAEISILSLEDHKIKVIIPKPSVGSIGQAAFSPDGHWIAYQADPTGTIQIYVQPFPPTGAMIQITTDKSINNIFPLWSPDGKQLFYGQVGGVAAGVTLRIMAVDVQTEPRFVFGKATPLPIYGFVPSPKRNFDISPDGKQFLVPLPPEQLQPGDRASVEINTVLNWFEELKQRVPIH